MAMGVTYIGGNMLTCGIESTCCAGTTCSGAFGCTETPSITVALAKSTISFVRFTCPWGARIAVTSVVSVANPCGPGFVKTIVLGYALGLI